MHCTANHSRSQTISATTVVRRNSWQVITYLIRRRAARLEQRTDPMQDLNPELVDLLSTLKEEITQHA
jgi:hypothetical protein